MLLLQPNWVPQRRYLKVRDYICNNTVMSWVFSNAWLVSVYLHSNVRLSSRLILLRLALIALNWFLLFLPGATDPIDFIWLFVCLLNNTVNILASPSARIKSWHIILQTTARLSLYFSYYIKSHLLRNMFQITYTVYELTLIRRRLGVGMRPRWDSCQASDQYLSVLQGSFVVTRPGYFQWDMDMDDFHVCLWC